jgi:MauM/NapG family ferredoxin protein
VTARSIRRLRRASQIIALLGFLGLFVFVTVLSPSRGLANLFYRLDPLVALTASLAGRALIGGMALALITIILTLLFGRVWCGWFCPLGTTLDLLKPRRSLRNRPAPPSEKWRALKYVLLAFIVVAAVFGNQSLLFLDPITILTRTLANAVWPALRYAVYSVEGFLYGFDFLWGPLDAVHAAVVYPIFKDVASVYNLAVPVFLFFAAIVALNWLAERFWCRYLCPLGGMLGLLSRISLFRRVVDDKCTACGACSLRCPTGTIDPQKGFASDPAECTVCYDCIESCQRDGSAIRWQGLGWKPVGQQAYDPSRREVMGTLGAATLWASLAGVETIRERQPANLLRPPGTDRVDFEALCIRCNECVRVCPTHGLQASLLEGGWQNVLTPRLVPRLGECSYNCNACGEVCPTGAIPLLSLEEKRHAPIGLARVDRNRCLPWNYNIDCIVCEETCPVAIKAIKLEIVEVTNAHGERVTMQRPYVIRELCTGCGMCEYKCPMGGESAIRVFAPTEAGGYYGDDSAFFPS